MYRELGHEGVVFGLRGGPYAGLPRTFSQAALPPHVLARLRRVVAGEGRPEPVLKQEGARTALSLVLPLAMTAGALGCLAPLVASGFGQPGALYQGPAAALLYAVCGAALALSAWLAWRTRRALLPRTGTYLLPLDVVEVHRDTVTVTPMGGVRQVTVEGEQGRPSLILAFEHGARFAFPVASEQEAERVLAHLEQAQDTLEHLTADLDLERALDVDPFFTLRGTGARGQEARLWELAARSPLRVALGWTAVAAAGVALGVGGWGLRNLASDQVLFEKAREEDSVASYGEYLSAGRLHRAEALRWQHGAQRVAELAQETRRFHEEEHRRGLEKQGEAPLDPCEPTVREDASPEQAQACYWRRATPRPERSAWFSQRIRQGKDLRVAFRRAPGIEASALLRSREQRLIEALGKVVQEVVPGRVMKVREATGKETPELLISWTLTRDASPGATPRDASPGATPRDASPGATPRDASPGVTLRDASPGVTLRAASPAGATPRDASSAGATRQGPSPMEATYTFDVSLATAPSPATFRLTMPPPKEPPALRVRSLYPLDGSANAPPREEQLMTARAFDRLYDEVYGLLFAGDPRVPLKESDEGTRSR